MKKLILDKVLAKLGNCICLLFCSLCCGLRCGAESDTFAYNESALVNSTWSGRALIHTCYYNIRSTEEEGFTKRYQNCPQEMLRVQERIVTNFQLRISTDKQVSAALSFAYPNETNQTFNISIDSYIRMTELPREDEDRIPEANVISFVESDILVDSQSGRHTLTLKRLRLRQSGKFLEGGIELEFRQYPSLFFCTVCIFN